MDAGFACHAGNVSANGSKSSLTPEGFHGGILAQGESGCNGNMGSVPRFQFNFN